jgi:hypothetical protein
MMPDSILQPELSSTISCANSSLVLQNSGGSSAHPPLHGISPTHRHGPSHSTFNPPQSSRLQKQQQQQDPEVQSNTAITTYWEKFRRRSMHSDAAASAVPLLNDFISIGSSTQQQQHIGSQRTAEYNKAPVAPTLSSPFSSTKGGIVAAAAAAAVAGVTDKSQGQQFIGPTEAAGHMQGPTQQVVPLLPHIPQGYPSGLESVLMCGLEGLLGTDLEDMGLTWELRPWWRAVDEVGRE